jgi:hypothetical protein
MPRPPETMIFAAVSSGRSLLESSEETYLEPSPAGTAATFSMLAEPPVAGAASKLGNHPA